MKKLKFGLLALGVLAFISCSGDGGDSHTHSYSTTWKSNDTSHWKECSCGEKSEVASHTEGNWTEVTSATETDDGEEKTTCTVCGKEYTRVIPVLGHSHTIATEWSSDETNHWHEASCGKVEHNEDKAPHIEGTWQVNVPATVTSTGVEKTTCIVCSKELTRVIPKLEGVSGSATLLANKVINSVECLKTEEVDICSVPTTIVMTDDSSWSGYVAESASAYYKGVYIKDRSVTLSPFAMSKYQVTQQLFEAVMGVKPSYFSSNPAVGETQNLRPVESVNWYAAIAFCNKLSIMEGLEPCYAVEGVDFTTLTYADIPTSTNTVWNAATCDFTKKGYRLPTEAEWEYAARGGKNSVTWGYSYAGSNTAKAANKFTESPYNDDALEAYAWYSSNSSSKTHEVGLKQANGLGLYDMSGNVWEWCWDWYNSTVVAEEVTDPTGPATGSFRLLRGGSWYDYAYYCAVSYRIYDYPYTRGNNLGFRLARSL